MSAAAATLGADRVVDDAGEQPAVLPVRS